MDPKKITLQFISLQQDLLRVTTFGAQALAESTIKTFEEFQVDWDYLKGKTAELLGLLRLAAGEEGGTPDLTLLETLGNDLYRELIPPSLRSKVAGGAGSDLLLSIDEDLVSIPWELLHDGEDFFCRRYNLGRIVHIPPSARRGEKRFPSSPVRVFSVADPEGDLPGALDEGLRIRDSLLLRQGAAELVLLTQKVRSADVLDGLRRADIFHFAGHVDRDEQGAAFRLSDGPCSAARISQDAGRYPFPCLVFMNGCRSSEGTDQVRWSENGQERAYDLASSFLLSGALHFIGTLWDIRDGVAARGGTVFFDALFEGMPVGTALTRAREDLAARYGEHSMVWGGYVLYGDPSFRLQGARDRKIEEGDVEVLLELLESNALRKRRQGAALLNIIVDRDLGYRPDGDPESRAAALDAFRQWCKHRDL